MKHEKLNVADAAAYVELAPGYLSQLRHFGKGPKFSRDGRRILYAPSDLDAWNTDRLAKRGDRKASKSPKATKATKPKTDKPKGKTAKPKSPKAPKVDAPATDAPATA